MQARRLHGLLLAGGKSRRMGQDKALLERNGETQLAYLARLMRPVVDEMFVSARRDQQTDAERARYPLLFDKQDDLGPVAGILSALQTNSDCDWLVVACDLPNVDHETLATLIAERDAQHPFTAFVSSHDGLPEPLCAIYGEGALSIVQSFVDAGMHCPRKILMKSDTQLLQQSNPASLDNINTPDDLSASVLLGSE